MRSGRGTRADTGRAGSDRPCATRGSVDPSSFVRDETPRPQERGQSRQTLRLAIECAPAEGLQDEHATTIVAARAELTDESGFFHALQRAVNRAGAHPHLRTGGLFDRLHDGVAVPRTIRQREQDVEHGRRQWRLTEGWDRLGHGLNLITVTDI